MPRPRKFNQRKQVTVIFESEEHAALRVRAAEQQQSVSAYVRAVVMSMLKRESAAQRRRQSAAPEK